MSTIYLDATTDKLKDAVDKCLKCEEYASSMNAGCNYTKGKEITKWLDFLSVGLFIGLLVQIKTRLKVEGPIVFRGYL